MELRIPPSRLQRRIRLLLRAYPPGYRADRGEEMLGTLLETTPDGRDWPSARDAWSLLAGGARARRARNRQLGPATSLRQAVVLGLALYVSWGAARFFQSGPLTGAHGTPVLAGLLLAATALAVWAGYRTLMMTTVAASLAVLAYCWYSYWAVPALYHRSFSLMVNRFTPEVPLLLALLALAHLTRRVGRPPRSWLILACLPLLAMLVTRALPVLLRPGPALGLPWNLLPGVLLLAIPILALAWLATDARPALGVALALAVLETVPLATMVQLGIAANDHERVASPWTWESIYMEALFVVMTVAMAWMLRRRARPHPR
jgi:hypothetical protein